MKINIALGQDMATLIAELLSSGQAALAAWCESVKQRLDTLAQTPGQPI